MIRHATKSLAALAVASLGAAGCESCKHERPYTPYTLGDAPSSGASAAPSSATVPSPSTKDAGASFAPIAGANAPGDGKSWTVGGATIDAPAGRVFASGIEVDEDGDGKPDLLAWAKTPDGARGEILFASSAKPQTPEVVLALPADLASPGCTLHAAFTLVGQKAVEVDFEPKCALKSRDRPPRWIGLVRGGEKAPALALELRARELPEGEVLKVGFDTTDRDGDGRADVTATLALTLAAKGKGAGGTASATVAFLDRPAGLSRDATEPEASLKAAASAVTADARKRTTASRVAGNAAALRALDSALCEDAGRAAIAFASGPVRCGDRRFVIDTRVAEVEAALNLGDALAAVAAMTRLDALGEKRKDLDKLFDKTVSRVTATPTAKAIGAAPKPLGAGVGPLAFLPGGNLLVMTSNGVVEVDKSTLAEGPSAASPFAERLGWPADAPQWTLDAVEVACSDGAVVGRFVVDGKPVSVPLPAGPLALPAPCASPSPAGVPLPKGSVVAIGDTTRSSLLAIGAEIVALAWTSPPAADVADTLATPSGLTVPFGVARSPDRSRIALIFPRGVLVAKIDANGAPSGGKLWVGDQLKKASFCVPSNDEARIACVVDSSAVLFDGK